MVLDEKFEIRVVVVEMREDGYGDIYSDFTKFKTEHPNSGYRFGCCVTDRENGCVPAECNDWNDSPEEALYDYFDNVYGKQN